MIDKKKEIIIAAYPIINREDYINSILDTIATFAQAWNMDFYKYSVDKEDIIREVLAFRLKGLIRNHCIVDNAANGGTIHFFLLW